MKRATWVVVVVLSGCGGGAELSLSFVNSQCNKGGMVLETGSDLDRNGTLDEAELESFYVFCLATKEISCATGDPSTPAGRLTWWDGQGRLVAQTTCGDEP